jgi:hypothetical protein
MTLPDSSADFPSFFDEYQSQISDILKRPMLFVCGAPKSGTTWVQLALNGHPEIHCGGEGHFTDWFGRPIHQMFSDYNDKMSKTNGFIYGERATYTQPLRRRDVQFLLRTCIGMTLLTVDVKPGAKWIGDKTPLYTHSLDYLRLAFPQARFVNIVRDVRDACTSTFHQAQRLYREGLNAKKREQPEEVIEPFVNTWRKVVTDTAKFQNQYPDLIHTLRYEDLHANPMETMRKVVEFLGVDASDKSVQACLDSGSFESLAKGRKRGEENRDSFFRKGIVGDWKNVFNATHLETILGIASKELAHYGYDITETVNEKATSDA